MNPETNLYRLFFEGMKIRSLMYHVTYQFLKYLIDPHINISKSLHTSKWHMNEKKRLQVGLQQYEVIERNFHWWKCADLF